MMSVNQSTLHAFNENQAARYFGVSEAALRLSGGWRRSRHKNWIQVSILSINPALTGEDGKGGWP
jgi:hypothetical protein